MPRLFVPSDLGDLLLGGLLSVARADGVVCPEEMDALRSAASDLGLTMPDEEELLLAEDVTPAALSAAIRAGAAAYRGGGSTPDEIGQSFLEAALRVALADHQLVREEVAALCELAAALVVRTDGIAGWRIVQAEIA